jgi:hypothetical protein
MNRNVLALMAALLILIAGAIQFASVDVVRDLAMWGGCDVDWEYDGNLQSCSVNVGWFEFTVASAGGIERISIRKSLWPR